MVEQSVFFPEPVRFALQVKQVSRQARQQIETLALLLQVLQAWEFKHGVWVVPLGSAYRFSWLLPLCAASMDLQPSWQND